ncbi:hypothetical protein BH09VER1_BH09VER1_03680 [soil metagenome]
MRNPSLRRTRAVALLLVLGGLVLISVVVLAFLHSTATELKSSKVYADGGNVRQLSDTAVNLVIGQIRDASKSRDGSGNRLAWASQPGMIRTYDDSGNTAGYYKLYSSSKMTGSGAFNPVASTETIPASWNTDTGFYVDLNEPLSGRYPIVDPGAIGKVEGFALEATAAAVSGKTNPVPMPAQWLYVLADGTIAAPTGAGSKAIVAGATPANPIVSRIAFWTDDETAKVNINTASEGTYWDMPRVNSVEDVSLSLNQPALNEFQRYAGHPATTSLSPVLGWKLPVTGTNGVYTYSELQPYFTLAPRINEGGSKAGTVNTASLSKITPDSDRLYATVDELEFRPDRTPLANSTPALNADDIDKVRFFLTARSRAPDVNLFNRPRVITWPISSQTDANHRTIWDRAIAFCGTIGGQKYYFQRNDPSKEDVDLTEGNNASLRSYLKNLTSANIPGFGGNFSSKYPSDRDQILTEIFDYIRCTNLCDNNGNESGSFVSFTPRTSTVGSAKGQVVPIYDAATDTRGFGRFPTLSEAALVFIASKDDFQAGPPAVPATKVWMKAALLLELFDPSLGFPVNIGNYNIQVTGLDGMLWPSSDPMFPPSPVLSIQGKTPIDQTRNFGGNEGFRAALAQNVSNKLFSSAVSGTSFPVGSNFAFPGGAVTVKFQTAGGTTVQTINLVFPAANIPVPLASAGGIPISQTNVPGNLQEFDMGLSGRFNNKLAGPGGAWVTQFDTVRSLSAQDGDYRLVAGRHTIDSSDNIFTPLSGVDSVLADYSSAAVRASHTLRESVGDPFNGAFRGFLVKNAPYWRATLAANNDLLNPATDGNMVIASGTSNGGGLATQCGDQDLRYNGVAVGKHGSFVDGTDVPGDWDNGFGDVQDGPYINRPDEGVAVSTVSANEHGPYYYPTNVSAAVDTAGKLFSPNRQMPSAVMFGSLSTGVKGNYPWQTLLFRPDPSGKHPGSKNRKEDGTASSGAPPDHLLLDLFQMPIVEPYPISEPLSTAGRINMNCQIVPYTYITRDTGIRAVLKSERLLCVDNIGTNQRGTNPGTTAVDYKQNKNASAGVPRISTVNWRKDIDLSETLKGFAAKFATGEIFRSATEICEIPLVPVGSTYSAASSPSTDFWYTNFPLTGDNSREKPYADIYPRLTTKSNTYAVHYRVQTLQKTRLRQANSATEFDTAAGDSVAGEFRGTSVIERYVDPNDATLPNFSTASLSDATSDLDSHYRFRTVSSKQFTP